MASNVREFNKTSVTAPPFPKFKVRIANSACASYISELTKDYMPYGLVPVIPKPMKNTAIMVKPNPTMNYWTMSLPMEWDNNMQLMYSIYSIDGKIHESYSTRYNPSIIIDGSTLSSGIYIFHIQNGSHQEKITLVKQ